MAESTKGIPSIEKTAFCCPHCGAYTTQNWSSLYSKSYKEDRRTPIIPNVSQKEEWEKDPQLEVEVKKMLVEWAERMCVGKPFPDTQSESEYLRCHIQNINISECYNCKEITVWVHDQIVYPNTKIEILPNQDLPPHIVKLFEEAREIVGSSPKGAAALLRLSIQYLCKELGESGKDINRDIASLVTKGLNPLVQKALDVVRVIGNEAVHPGEINLDDNREMALQLFNVINLIADQMITHPKQVEAMYSQLPESKLEGIEQRDKKSIESSEKT
ncbi:DUF4145 domain-containing protein [Shewanella xiamenensis]|uniref:DUF4145 domain-containing protein n=1 Tax=Shewanella xiamenensis TaxID=332186 RepID=UPI001CC72EE2|nr:DUF4145 domain-containing protein [Shewanella xiamenensis]BDA62092.1 hypothetical protein NUITMVS1_35550 [Shewanella xiamenensis]